MAHREDEAKEPMQDVTEEQFLKNLYVFMKKRDTPIERIPNLGFKQVDLFVMFKTVNELGGYHQVTSHQLWKQVYNVLGGNPRSTSAATCTRRHYEKLLLPYECTLKGIIMSGVPQHPKPCRYDACADGGQRPSKRRMISSQMQQRPPIFQSDHHVTLYPLPLHYPQYYHPRHPLLPPYGLIPPPALPTHAPHVLEPQLPLHPPHPDSRLPDSTEVVKEPLEQLRFLAEQYKTSSGLVEPLNLSKRAPPQQASCQPVSSFSPPSSSKNPKFLNKPSTLYTARYSGPLRHEGSETKEDVESEGAAPFLYSPKEREANVGVRAFPRSGSPAGGPVLTLEADDEAFEVDQKPSSPGPAEDREPVQFDLSQILQNLPQQKDGRMEIEVPLSVFRNWLKSCGSSATLHGAKEPPVSDHDELLGRRRLSDGDILPTHVKFPTTPQDGSSAEDLSVRSKSNPASDVQSVGRRNPFVTYKPFPSAGDLRITTCRETWPSSQEDADTAYSSKPTDLWDAYKKEILAPFRGCSPPRAAPDLAPREEEDVTAGKTTDSAVLMLNPTSASTLHLTPDEVMKLKRIISNSK